MKNYRLHLIRHFEAEGSENGVFMGNTKNHLKASSKRYLEELKEEYVFPPCEVIYSSPAVRCIETARLLYPELDPIICDELGELDFGVFEGKTMEELQDNNDYRKWVLDAVNSPPPGGERVANFLSRIFEGLDLIFKDMSQKGIHDGALVTHGGVIMSLLASFGLPREKVENWITESGTGYTILLNPQMWLRDNLFEIHSELPYSKEFICQENKDHKCKDEKEINMLFKGNFDLDDDDFDYEYDFSD